MILQVWYLQGYFTSEGKKPSESFTKGQGDLQDLLWTGIIFAKHTLRLHALKEMAVRHPFKRQISSLYTDKYRLHVS